ncbi:MAG: hypothetical protein GXP54_05275 [Deltaproteobacteria bacterium]|nr:hypothetical protein [Deltaproteobacteria bacterium]
MTDSRVKKGLFVVLGVLLAVAVATVIARYDPELARIRSATLGYIEDLKQRDFASASKRVFKDDLLALKSSSIDMVGSTAGFRRDVEEFFGTQDPAEIRAQSRLRFFQLMVWRTFDRTPDVHEALRRGEVVGVSLDRDGDSAKADVTLALATAQGQRQIQMHLKLIRDGDQWWIRI